jgi:hypothetical protein
MARRRVVPPSGPHGGPTDALRDEVVARARLRHILCAFSCAHFGVDDGEVFAGDPGTGFLALANGEGDHHLLAWSPEGVVGIELDHEMGESEIHLAEEARDPGRWLADAPGELSELVERASAFGDRRATGGMWIRGGVAEVLGDTSQLRPYTRDVAEALAAWLAGHSLTPAQGAIAVRLAASAPCAIGEEDATAILAPPIGWDRVLRPEDVEAAAAMLARVGVVWTGAPRRAEAVAASRRDQAEASQGSTQAALLRAVDAGDEKATRRLLAAGAQVDCRTLEGQTDRLAGETPLLLAIRRGHTQIARLLLDHGASADALVPGHGWPLDVAAAGGDAALCRLLIERGGAPISDHGWRGITLQVPDEDAAAVMRVLVEGGAPLPLGSERRRLALVAERAGAGDIAALLRTRPHNPKHDLHPTMPATAVSALPKLPVRRSGDLLVLIEAARDHLLAGDDGDARESLLDAWRLTRHPRFADAVDALRDARPLMSWSDAEIFGQRTGTGRVADGPETLESLEGFLGEPADPQLTRSLVGLLDYDHFYDCLDCVERAAESTAAVLVHTCDVRAIPWLDRLGSSALEYGWIAQLHGVPEAVRSAQRLLESFTPDALIPEAAAMAELEDVIAGRPRPSRGATAISELFRAVWADPDADEPRNELAARLCAIDDPRGELISLQMKRHATAKAASRREKELLAEHGREWLGAIERLVDDVEFERGFLERAATGKRGDRGMLILDGAPLGFGSEAEWSTVRRLSVGHHKEGTAGLLRSPRLLALREVADITPVDFHDVLAGPPRRWTSLTAFMPRTVEWWSGPAFDAMFERMPDALPGLVDLSFSARELPPAVLERTLGRLSRLEELSLAYRPDGLSELVAIGASRGLRTVRLLIGRMMSGQRHLLPGPGDIAVDLETRTVAIELPGKLHDAIAKTVALALGGIESISPTALVLRPPPRAKVNGHDPEVSDLPLAYSRGKERIDLTPIWNVGKRLGLPCRAGQPLERHWSRCPEALE